MNLSKQPDWVLRAWEEFEMELLRRRKTWLISYVGNQVEIKESKRIPRKRGFDCAGSFGEIIIISSKLCDSEKTDLLAFLLVDEAEDLQRMLESAPD